MEFTQRDPPPSPIASPALSASTNSSFTLITTPNAIPFMPTDPITLDVSGVKFRTLMGTIGISPWFRDFFTRWGHVSDRQPDGSYFIDADPEMFVHVLAYLRRSSKFPLFWTKESGFDYVMYSKLELEAEFFGLHNLCAFIRKERYLDAVKFHVFIKELNLDDIEENNSSGSGSGSNTEHSGIISETIQVPCDGEFQIFFGSKLAADSRAGCPRGVHRRGQHCSVLCEDVAQQQRRVGGEQVEEEGRTTTVVTKVTMFDPGACDNAEMQP